MLQIARVREDDAGRYTCQAVNEAGEDHMHFELHILGMHVLYRRHDRKLKYMKHEIGTSISMMIKIPSLHGLQDVGFNTAAWVFVWVYLLSASSDNGSNRAVYGGDSSGGQQHCGSPL